MAYDPVSTSALDRYRETLERSGDPVAAWEAAWGEAALAVEAPESRYVRLLEAGERPDRAWERAYGAVEPLKVALLDDVGEAEGPILVDPTEFFELPVPPPSAIYHVPGGSAKAELLPLGDSSVTEYDSYVYRVVYPYGPRVRLQTFMRLSVPRVPLHFLDRIGLVLVLEGDLNSNVGVDPAGEASESLYSARSRLVAGTSYDDDLDRSNVLPYRDGDPMVVAYFSHPGRGPGDHAADGDPAFLHEESSPGNTTGRDLWGDTTVLAADCVLGLAMNILRSMARSSGNRLMDIRILVLSSSAGLTAAARWIAITPWRIHALVDTEGPGDSMEITGSHNAWQESNMVEVEVGVAWRLPTSLTWSRWCDWTGVEAGSASDEFLLFYRTPGAVLSDAALGEGGADFADALTTWGDARWFGFLPAEDERFRKTMRRFWRLREPSGWLAAAVNRGMAYVRLQGVTNHATAPDWYRGRNAVRNLHAAFTAGVDGMVFYGGEEWRRAREAGLGGVAADPTCMEEDLDPDIWDGTWPSWCADSPDAEGIVARFFFSYAWQAQVDVLRWAYQTDFPWTPPVDLL